MTYVNERACTYFSKIIRLNLKKEINIGWIFNCKWNGLNIIDSSDYSGYDVFFCDISEIDVQSFVLCIFYHFKVIVCMEVYIFDFRDCNLIL